jgi:hypothetical protein
MSTVVSGYEWNSARRTVDLGRNLFRNVACNRSVLSVLLALPFALALVRGGTNARRAVLASVATAVALIALIAWGKKEPPERVVFPLMSFPLATALLCFAWRNKAAEAASATRYAAGHLAWARSWADWQSKPLRARVVLTLITVSLVMGVYRQGRRSVHVQDRRASLQRFLDTLTSGDRKLYISWETALPYELASPLDNLDEWDRAAFLSLAWTQGTPWQEELKREFGIVSTAKAMYLRDDVELIAQGEHRELFATFAKEHFGADVEFVPRIEVGHNSVAGRFRERTSAANIAAQPDGAVRN